ncbi:uncharacterized protein LOC132263714 [Phlebotomus argentipes]|uniref:uncharacterized protein LOC132263714 n=1 Tax=Phlebotomus argentipes TaxID=94469 RepID=UPI0028931C51|nr:uncharacterized protein LOC132263714 [Phlebotomus argentipes]
MGGCRCTFQTCENNSANSPNMHFFHFPAKKTDLCRKWAKFANRVEFMSLPLDKLKNKVVCQMHFRTESFMNYLQNSLVKTAYPTLMRFEDVVIDLEKDSPEEQVAKLSDANQLVMKLDVPEMEEGETAQDNFVIDILQSTEDDINISPGENLMISNARQSNQQNFIFELNQVLEDKVVTPRKEHKTPAILNPAYKQASRTKVTQNVGCVVKKPLRKPAPPSDVKLTARQEVLMEMKMKSEPVRQTVREVIEFESPDVVPQELPKQPEEPKRDEALECMAKELGELKQMVLETVSTLKAVPPAPPAPQPTSTSTAESSNGSKGEKSMNKLQLFNAIKRYLNPSMVALLRMEMFGGMDREWKQDEKEFSVELYNLGLNVYEFMRDEWRFRLPPEKAVQKWASEM